ncbi:aminotransferase class I/II-fold pyridoxal phosphate-dependent enzyme [Bdellovibrionota bacterium FG-2]
MNDTLRSRRIPSTSINLFQKIYVLLREYEAKSGKKALNLSLGNPDSVPPSEVLKLQAEFALKPDFELHTYAEDNNLNQFCEGMVQRFTGVEYRNYPQFRAVSIPGIKTATALLPLACGMHMKERQSFNVVTHMPAYDVMGTWSTSYLGAQRIVWPLTSQSGMRMEFQGLVSALKDARVARPDLIFVIRPGNPASQGAQREEWTMLIEYCIENKVRLVNDGAYTTLAPAESHVPLIQVAKDYPSLEWMELLSVSKSFSDPGARLGVAVGSQEFIEDFILIKGNTESGPVPSVMAAYGELFKNENLCERLLSELLAFYQDRLNYLIPKLKNAGFVQACESAAGFFTLWKTPDGAYGIDVREEAVKRGLTHAECFNQMVIERSGIVGVHFAGPYIRYAVCTDVLSPDFQNNFDLALGDIAPKYFSKTL